MSDERPIGDYALLGDTRTAALVSSQGSIDWMCLPRFDSDAIFSRLIAGDLGSSFSITPLGLREVNRSYVDESAILETAWRTESGDAVLTDGMVVEVAGRLLPQMVLVRELECTGGQVDFQVLFNPLLGLPGKSPVTAKRGGALICQWGSMAVALQSSRELGIEPGVVSRFQLRSGEKLTLVLTMADRSPLIFVEPSAARDLLTETSRWWQEWVGASTYAGPSRKVVNRSLITLRLLTYSPSGAPVAAPTTSLPEVVGGADNWDYRYSWPRDASLGVDAFVSVGMHEEPKGFIRWLIHADRLTRPEIQVLYTLFGKPVPREVEVAELPGYRGSRPVRLGNGARDQFQLDVYGWVLDAAWRFEQAGHPLFRETWRAFSSSVDFICDNWQRPDNGIWEVRGQRRDYVQSKLMCWLSLERAIGLARAHKTKESSMKRWVQTRDEIAAIVKSKGRDERGAFVRTFGSNEMDAAVLAPLTELAGLDGVELAPTIDAVMEQLGAGEGLIYRYPPPDEKRSEGAFAACSFWLVQALAVEERVEEASSLFDQMCFRANDVGLFAEEIDPTTGEHLGNFPQALTHASLIRAAAALSARLEE